MGIVQVVETPPDTPKVSLANFQKGFMERKTYNAHAVEMKKGKPPEPARAKHTTQTLGFPSSINIDQA